MKTNNLLLSLGGLLVLAFCFTACTAVQFNQKERLADRIMIFDGNPLTAEIQGHMILPRETALGGFGSVGAGGCSCK